ncbi:proline-rich membrane anchor 1-like [Myxocyprinus asiaticus]|uniref:proline-rich membrane anchor 1-like n=1 Tax=Myxocyprinus asiaticus TaxID=70543 RepID=UPI002222E53C|nr:proline-rich membrane anchor 1-like [Myxocyprinus asiaticus]
MLIVSSGGMRASFRLFFSWLLLVCQAELQWSCSQHGINRGGEDCQLLCRCRMYPPLPPPPPPPPPPRALVVTATESSGPVLSSWWTYIFVFGTIGSALALLLLLMSIICYKAIKRKPLKKEKNSASCGEYAMSSFKTTKNAATNNAVV